MSASEAESGPLSPREREIAEAYADGLSYRAVADRLHLAPGTVRTHLGAVYRKLGVTSKLELVRALEGEEGAARPAAAEDAAEIIAELALELDEAIRRERVLAHVLRIISREGRRREAVLDAVLEHALELCEAEFGILFEYGLDGRYQATASRDISPEFAAWFEARGAFEAGAATALGRVAATAQVVNIFDVRGEGVYREGEPLRVATAELGRARSFAAIPMISAGVLIGAFTVYRTRVHPFNARALELAQLFADQASIAIENARGREERRGLSEAGEAAAS